MWEHSSDMGWTDMWGRVGLSSSLVVCGWEGTKESSKWRPLRRVLWWSVSAGEGPGADIFLI